MNHLSLTHAQHREIRRLTRFNGNMVLHQEDFLGSEPPPVEAVIADHYGGLKVYTIEANGDLTVQPATR